MKTVKKILKSGWILGLLGTMIMISGCATKQTAVQTSSAQQPVQQTKQESKKDVIEAAGKIMANDTRNIIVNFPAIIKEVNIDEGQRVKKGDELITLDTEDFKQQIYDMESSLNQGKTQLEISKSNLSTIQKELQRERNQYDDEVNNTTAVDLKESAYQYAQKLLSRAKEDLEDQKKLYESSVISSEALKASQRRVEDTEKTVNDAKLALESTKFSRQQGLDQLKAGIDQQAAQEKQLKMNIEIQSQKLKTLELDLQQLKDKLNKTYIKDNKIICDIENGLVQQITHVAGDPVIANTKLFNLVDMDNLVVEAGVTEDFVKDVKIGAEVQIFPLSDSSKQYTGHVVKIADMGVEKNGETFVLVEISIDDGDEFIKPNYNVDVQIAK